MLNINQRNNDREKSQLKSVSFIFYQIDGDVKFLNIKTFDKKVSQLFSTFKLESCLTFDELIKIIKTNGTKLKDIMLEYLKNIWAGEIGATYLHPKFIE